MNSENILNETITEVKKLRELSLSNAKFSLKEAIKKNVPVLQPIADLNDLDIDEFVERILQKNRTKDEEPELNPGGRPYLNNMFKKRKNKTENNVDEFGRQDIDPDTDKMIFDYGDDDEDEQSDFADEVIKERIRKNHSLISRSNFHPAPAVVSSGINTIKLSNRERDLLTRNLSYKNPNLKSKTVIKSDKKDTDILRRRAGIKQTGKVKQIIEALDNKYQLLRS